MPTIKAKLSSTLSAPPARRPSARAIAAIAIATTILGATPVIAGADMAAGDLAWRQRADSQDGSGASLGRIEESIRAFREAQDSIEARWKLIRSLHFLVEFSHAPESRKDEAVDEAVEIAKDSIEILERGAGSDADRAQLYFWSAIAWGARAQRVGLITIVREGVANQMRDYARRAASIEPSIERGGAFRLLSRLHGTLPRVPFVSGWVDRGKTLPLAESAYAIDQSDPGNRLILAMALLEQEPDRREEAITLLGSAARATPRPELLVEDRAIREEARRTLDATQDPPEDSG